jgi:mRNA interferase MazF
MRLDEHISLNRTQSRLKSPLGTLSKADMLAVEDAIKIHLALPR